MKVAEDTMPSIVSITSVSTSIDNWFGMEYSNEGSGSGIIVGKDDNELLIATNNHVVDGTDKITVTFIDESQADAVIKGTDSKADLAVIAVDLAHIEKSTVDAIKIAKLGNSDDIKVGEMTIAIGNAMGYGQSLTVGYVSAKDRKIEVSDNYSYNTMVLLQTDAAINPGNSGGALLNIKGEVIGINTVKFANYQVEGMGYAIPISRAIPIINELMSREILKPEEQGFLGVGPQDVTEDISEMFGLPIGVYISTIVEGSAADKAGLKVGDVIQFVNDVEISSGVQLRELISSIRVGTEIEIKYMRHLNGSYKEWTVKVVLGSREGN
jgi:serine protease Do